MSVISFSSHPVWHILEKYGIPPEIIIKIFGFRTVLMSPSKKGIDEFMEIKDVYNINCCQICEESHHNSLLNAFITQTFNDNVDSDRYFNLTITFLSINMLIKPTSKLLLLSKFLKYIEDYKYLAEDPLDRYIRLNNNIDCTNDLLGTMLFTLCMNEYKYNFHRIYSSTDIDYKIEDKIEWDEVLQLHVPIETYFWKNMICSLLNIKNVTKKKWSLRSDMYIAPKIRILKWCRVFGIKHYKSWNKNKLISALLKNEPTGFNYLRT